MSVLTQRKFALHGTAVEIDCSVQSVGAEIAALLGPFMVATLPLRFPPCGGSVRAYDADEVLRRLSPTARPLARTADLVEIYAEDERFWVVDDRWGVCELNMLKSQWRSWVIPSPKLSAFRCFEMTVLWPMAQLLRSRGLHLLPAASVARDQWGLLLISPFGLEPELSTLIRGGYRIIGQRWTAIREEDGRFVLLHLPGRVEQPAAPRLRRSPSDDARWVDVTRDHPHATQGYAFCEAVLVAEHGRRPRAHLREVDAGASASLLQRRWPIPELHPQRRPGQFPRRLARSARCGDIQLSRSPQDLMALLESFRATPTRAAA